MALYTYLPIITLNVKGLNAPAKRHRGAEWIRKQDPYICCLCDPHQIEKHTQIKSKEMEKDIAHKWKRKKMG